jgi:hypothetical protein
MLFRISRSFLLAALLAAPAHLAQSAAQPGADSAYPGKPVRILAGFTPGGTVAAATAAYPNADGYTLLSVASAHAVAPAIYPKLGSHFAAEQFKTMAGIDVVHVPYKGIPEALTDCAAS